MKREELKEIGLTDEQIDSVMASHGKDIERFKGLEAEIATLKQANDALNTEKANYSKSLEELSAKAKGNEELTTQLDAMKKASDEAKAKYDSDLANFKKNSLIDLALTERHAKNLVAVKAVMKDKLDALTVENDKLVNFDEVFNEAKKGNEFLFDTVGPQAVGTQPNLGAGKTEDEIMKELQNL